MVKRVLLLLALVAFSVAFVASSALPAFAKDVDYYSCTTNNLEYLDSPYRVDKEADSLDFVGVTEDEGLYESSCTPVLKGKKDK